jgi:hypothetical protein
MSLRLLFRGIAATVKRHEAAFREARAVEPRFAPYPTGPDVLTAAAPGSPVPMRERQQLVGVFLGLHQTTRHPLWQALLLQAFRPTLFALRRRQYGPEEDRDARLLVAFLQVVARGGTSGRPRRPRCIGDRRAACARTACAAPSTGCAIGRESSAAGARPSRTTIRASPSSGSARRGTASRRSRRR